MDPGGQHAFEREAAQGPQRHALGGPNPQIAVAPVQRNFKITRVEPPVGHGQLDRIGQGACGQQGMAQRAEHGGRQVQAKLDAQTRIARQAQRGHAQRSELGAIDLAQVAVEQPGGQAGLLQQLGLGDAAQLDHMGHQPSHAQGHGRRQQPLQRCRTAAGHHHRGGWDVGISG
jgi:hypothetical protein